MVRAASRRAHPPRHDASGSSVPVPSGRPSASPSSEPDGRLPRSATRDGGRRAAFSRLVPDARAVISPEEVVAAADLILLTVPDDAIAAVSAALRLESGQTLVHTSGLLGADILRPAPWGRSVGPAVGAFHPLVSFTADVERSVAALRGATVAIEGDDAAIGRLAALADAIGGRSGAAASRGQADLSRRRRPRLRAGWSHCSTQSPLSGPRPAWTKKDRSRSTAVSSSRRCPTRGAIGIAPALTGPITRGDAGTLESHLAALGAGAPDVMEIYLAAAHRELRIAEERGTLAPDRVAQVGDVLAKDRRPGTICG